VAKPKSSRNSSIEAFVVCQGFRKNGTVAGAAGGGDDAVVPFVACGDLSGFDSDASYPLGASYEFKDVVQAPVNPAHLPPPPPER